MEDVFKNVLTKKAKRAKENVSKGRAMDLENKAFDTMRRRSNAPNLPY